MEIWKEAVAIAQLLFDIAEDLKDRNYYRFADQLFGAGIGIPNNISESTGTQKIGEQQQLLRYARRECFEAANILIILGQRNLISGQTHLSNILERLDILSRRITSYSKSLGI